MKLVVLAAIGGAGRKIFRQAIDRATNQVLRF
jgi:hypothetical protein